jgi:hypothetical protein
MIIARKLVLGVPGICYRAVALKLGTRVSRHKKRYQSQRSCTPPLVECMNRLCCYRIMHACILPCIPGAMRLLKPGEASSTPNAAANTGHCKFAPFETTRDRKKNDVYFVSIRFT